MTFAEACKQLRDDIEPDGSLYNLGRYLCWNKGETTITLDDKFTVEDLEAIVAYIKGIDEV